MKSASLTKSEALQLLASQERTNKPSDVNPGLTQSEVLDMLQGVVEAQPDGFLRLALVADIRKACGVKVERS